MQGRCIRFGRNLTVVVLLLGGSIWGPNPTFWGDNFQLAPSNLLETGLRAIAACALHEELGELEQSPREKFPQQRDHQYSPSLYSEELPEEAEDVADTAPAQDTAPRDALVDSIRPETSEPIVEPQLSPPTAKYLRAQIIVMLLVCSALGRVGSVENGAGSGSQTGLATLSHDHPSFSSSASTT